MAPISERRMKERVMKKSEDRNPSSLRSDREFIRKPRTRKETAARKRAGRVWISLSSRPTPTGNRLTSPASCSMKPRFATICLDILRGTTFRPYSVAY